MGRNYCEQHGSRPGYADVSARLYSIRQGVTSDVQSIRASPGRLLLEPSREGWHILLSCVCIHFLGHATLLTVHHYEQHPTTLCL